MKPFIDTLRPFAGAILIGALVAVVGIAPWAMLAPLNARIRPDLPWAALTMAAFMTLYLAWLNGAGWPDASREARRYSLRLWRPTKSTWSRDGVGPTAALILLMALLYLLWIAMSTSQPPPDLSAYPTTVYRISVVFMGAIVSGVIEEAAFRGYLQSRLERYGAGTAIVVTSVVFALFHSVHGWQTLLFMGPGLFIASVLYGMLAYHTGSIVPGIVVHVLGDLAHTVFGVLQGNFGLLVVQQG
jgi:membrane protease YdiL (CAAX protease family)